MSELLEAGVTVTAIGMGVVFALLMLLVGVIRAMSYLSSLFEEPVVGQLAAGSSSATTAEGSEIAGVIGAAVTIHRKRRQQR